MPSIVNGRGGGWVGGSPSKDVSYYDIAQLEREQKHVESEFSDSNIFERKSCYIVYVLYRKT